LRLQVGLAPVVLFLLLLLLLLLLHIPRIWR
jgi:hypothetical protein